MLQRMRRLPEQLRATEALELPLIGQMRLEREEAVIAVCAQAPQQFGPARHALACGDDSSIRERVFDVNVAQPRMQRLIGVWIGRLGALDEIGRIEYRSQMLIGTVLVQVMATSDGVALDVLLVLMQQDDVVGAR